MQLACAAARTDLGVQRPILCAHALLASYAVEQATDNRTPCILGRICIILCAGLY